MPGGVLPCLELGDSNKMSQSKAIMRYLGAKHGYQPHDALAAYKSDSISDAYYDFFPKIYAPLFCQPALKSTKIDQLFNEFLPSFLGQMEGFAKEANKKGHWIAGPNLTVADFRVGSLFVNLITNKKVAFAP